MAVLTDASVMPLSETVVVGAWVLGPEVAGDRSLSSIV